MTSTLPSDPYKCLGVSKDAKLPEIRSAHRKLVLKCHPDKVHDAALKAIKQEEFQKVQQAYEILSDDARRTQYDEQVKLFELRKEMGRGNPTPRSNPFEYEVRTAEPRADARPSSYGRPTPKVYSYPSTGSRSHEDMTWEDSPRHVPRKSSSAEYTDRKRPSAREAERERERRRHDEEEARRAFEKETKRAHSDKKKSRDKDRRSRTEEKTRARATGVYVEDDSAEEYRPRSAEKKSSRHKIEENQGPSVPLAEKWDEHLHIAAKYMQTVRRNHDEETFQTPPRMPPRAETFSGGSPSTPYNVRYAQPSGQFSDDETPRRSSARKSESRRTSETPREKSRGERRSPSHIKTDGGYINIVEPPSPPPPSRKPPPLQTYASAPIFTSSRDKPSRSKTQDYPRKETIPPLPRANTFQVNDRDRPRERGGSRLRNAYNTSSSDDEQPGYSPRVSQSPPRMPQQQHTRYVVENGRTVPVANATHRHREPEDYSPRQRQRSPSPAPRPQLFRSPAATRDIPTHSPQTSYYPSASKPIVMEARPKMPAREGSSHRTSSRNVPTPGYMPFDHVAYSPNYGPENVKFANMPVRGAEHYTRGRGMEGVYAS